MLELSITSNLENVTTDLVLEFSTLKMDFPLILPVKTILLKKSELLNVLSELNSEMEVETELSMIILSKTPLLVVNYSKIALIAINPLFLDALIPELSNSTSQFRPETS